MPSTPGPILVVDDNLDDVEAIKRMASKSGIKNPILSVPSAEEAISYLLGEHEYSDRELFPIPTLILLDWLMPGAGGFAVLQWLHEQPLHVIPTVVLTAYRQLKDLSVAYQMGAYSFLMKPLQQKELLELVSTFKGVEVQGEVRD